jgi:hypothetical protein
MKIYFKFSSGIFVCFKTHTGFATCAAGKKNANIQLFVYLAATNPYNYSNPFGESKNE